jgi:hypothetical protein
MTSTPLLICTIPVSIFRASPYDLPWGSSIFAKVIATNIYGDSLESLEGNGAVITTTPDAPVNIAEDYSLRTKDSLGIVWEQATFIGGAVIEDYRISIAE